MCCKAEVKGYLHPSRLPLTLTRLIKQIQEHCLSEQSLMDSGKIIDLQDILCQAKRAARKTLVFSQWTQTLDIIEKALAIWEFPAIRLDGSTKLQVRQQLVDRFNQEKEIEVFLLSTGAGSVG